MSSVPIGYEQGVELSLWNIFSMLREIFRQWKYFLRTCIA